MTKTVAIYARFSNEKQNPMSNEDQISLCRKYADAQGWTVTHVFSDAAKTSRTGDRQGFRDVLEAARQRQFDVVLVEAVSRLSRKVVDSLQGWELMLFSGVSLHSVSEGEQDFLRVLMHALGAQMVSDKIGEQTRRGLVGMLEREDRVHTLAYGYRKRKTPSQNGVNREIDPVTAPIVLRIYDEAAEGRSGDDIARGLNSDGIPAPQGGIWHASTIRSGSKYGSGLLRKTIYRGLVTYGRTENRLHPETGARRIVASPAKRVIKEVAKLRIVLQELWDRVQARLDASAQKVALSPKANPRAAHARRSCSRGS